MSRRSWAGDLIVSLRFVSLLFGVALIILSLFLLASILAVRASSDTSQFLLFYEAVLALGILAGGLIVVHSITKKVRLRTPDSPLIRIRKFTWPTNHGYGFTSAYSIGLGTTLGSPLFVLIPISILQNGSVGLIALLAGAAISFAAAHVYGRMYRDWARKGMEADGGPAFTRNACGRVSLRYFIARFGMWVGNTSLAAYSLIIFINYSRFGFSRTLLPLTGPGALLVVIPIILMGLLSVWWVINAFYEKRFGKAIGQAQIITTMVLVVILVAESVMLLQSGSRPVGSIFTLTGDSLSLAVNVLTNTAFLFIHYFGFQEIQALSQDFAPTSKIPGLSIFPHFRNMDKVSFSNYAMMFTVGTASFINVFYALGVYSAAPSLASLQAASVPAVFIARTVLGPWQGLFMAIAFSLASLTTFVPAFLASSRHLKALSHDGFFPQSVGKLAWLFSIVSVIILSLFNGAFLASITDFGVLVSLAFIILSAVWSKNRFARSYRRIIVPFLTGLACVVTAGALYLVDPNVVLFGVMFVMIGYLIFDIFELGSYGSQLFLVILYTVFLGLTGILFKSGVFNQSSGSVSLGLMRDAMEAAIAVLALNLLLGARPGYAKRLFSTFRTTTTTKLHKATSMLRSLRERRDLDRSVDRWMKLMDSDRIQSRDPENFERVRQYLEKRLRNLRETK